MGLLTALCLGTAVGCTGKPEVVTRHFAYTPEEQSNSRWRALLAALDECHREGFQDADPAGRAKAVCDSQNSKGCVHFQATQSYECVGMGYQLN